MALVPAAATSPPFARTTCVPRITLLTRDISAKIQLSGIRITVIPADVRLFSKWPSGSVSSSREPPPPSPLLAWPPMTVA